MNREITMPGLVVALVLGGPPLRQARWQDAADFL